MIREYEGIDLAESYDQLRPNYSGKIVEEILAYLRKNCVYGFSKRIMLDVGCGGGKSTKLFTPYFDSILGIDISEGQIKFAKENNKADNIEYRLIEGNIFPLEDGTVDFVNCATTAHYLDLNLFESECERVLKPGGCAAVYAYAPFTIKSLENEILAEIKQDSEYKQVMVKFIRDCGAHEGNLAVLERYKPIYDQLKNETKQFKILESTVPYTVTNFLKLHETVFGYSRFRGRGGKDPLTEFGISLRKLLKLQNTPDDQLKFNVVYEYPLILFYKAK
ncbi:putative methyltransferase DDB_G0268948 [Styela clava]